MPGEEERRTVSNAASIPNPRRLIPRQLEHRKRRVPLAACRSFRCTGDGSIPPIAASIAASARTLPTPSRTDYERRVIGSPTYNCGVIHRSNGLLSAAAKHRAGTTAPDRPPRALRLRADLPATNRNGDRQRLAVRSAHRRGFVRAVCASG
jgi:hypothetical protein